MSDKCEHKTTNVKYNHGYVIVEVCTWGCGQTLMAVKDASGLTHTFTHAELAALRARVEALEAGRDAKIEKLKAVLRFVEWHGNNDGWECCPYCYSFDKHSKDCELSAALNS